MDDIRSFINENGKVWSVDTAMKLVQMYSPLHQAQIDGYKSTIEVRKGNKYGPDPRNRVDVYYPKARSSSLAPVIVYFHGGGFTLGDNDLTPPGNEGVESTIYGNIAYYFSSRGYVSCLATYRLVGQTAKFPSGPEDIAAALTWVQANISSYGGDPSQVVALGQSAGGTHLGNAVFMGLLGSDKSTSLIRGAALLSAPLGMYCNKPDRLSVLSEYFNTPHTWELEERFSTNAIFRQAYFGDLTSKPRQDLPCKLLVVMAEMELDEVAYGNLEFMKLFRDRTDRFPPLHILKGHNHVSYVMGLGLEKKNEDEDDFGSVTLRFIRGCTMA
ncbi:alpha/beta-hydrolase [Nemania sp. FL0916]|nr:alpha/beta-hydrolase [Nemania sp. FL0916]